MNGLIEKIKYKYKTFKNNHYPRIKPKFIIIGAQKSGTTSLFHYIGQHEDIKVPSRKEMHFFCYKYGNGRSWYLKQFPFYEFRKVTGEATPYYFFHPEVPRRLYSFDKSLKFILVLRNPIDRAFSHYQMSLSRGYEDRNFYSAITDEIKQLRLGIQFNDKRDIDFKEKSYVSRGLYGEQLERWFHWFAKEQFLIIESKQFFNNPEKITLNCIQFIGEKKEKYINKSFANQFSGEHNEVIDVSSKVLLANFFQSDIEKLEGLTGRKFDWLDEFKVSS